MESSGLCSNRLTKEDVSFCSCARMGKGKECRCGEEEEEFTWLWDPYSTQSDSTLMKDGREVIFHSNYSSGTAAIRGTEPFRDGHHFWEVKMTTPVYGTDMMVGVATADLELDKFVHTFTSLLGRDSNSWGLSYLGTVHHKGSSRPYSDKLGQGAIVGVHLDMWQGTLSFYVNRRPLGVAYRGLQGKTLYPVVTSTAARSGMKVITTKWFPHSLQFQCCQTLRSCVKEDQYVLDAVSLPPGLNTFLSNNLGWLLRSYPSFPDAVTSPLWRYRHLMGRPFNAVSSADRSSASCSTGRQGVHQADGNAGEGSGTTSDTTSQSQVAGQPGSGSSECCAADRSEGSDGEQSATSSSVDDDDSETDLKQTSRSHASSQGVPHPSGASRSHQLGVEQTPSCCERDAPEGAYAGGRCLSRSTERTGRDSTHRVSSESSVDKEAGNTSTTGEAGSASCGYRLRSREGTVRDSGQTQQACGCGNQMSSQHPESREDDKVHPPPYKRQKKR